MSARLWTLVLAAGAGRRLAGVTGGVPKQFWSADGGPSFLEQTVARVADLVPSSRTVTVVDRRHRPLVEALAGRRSLGRILYQPADRGTAAGVLLGLIEIVEAAPNAIVVITPSDHGITRSDSFAKSVRRAAGRIESDLNEIILFGARPTAAAGDYGWITPGARPGPETGDAGAGAPAPVVAFVEKPGADDAARLLASGAVWNTMVLVARADALFDLYRRHLPGLAQVFDRARQRPPPARQPFLTEHYPHVPPADFSRDLLTPARGLAVCIWPADIGWSDLGTPDRLDAWRNDQRPLPARAREGRPTGARLEPQVA